MRKSNGNELANEENQNDIPGESLEFADILKISNPFHKPGSQCLKRTNSEEGPTSKFK